jgi:nucleoside-diphosphate-sugar epimerase
VFPLGGSLLSIEFPGCVLVTGATGFLGGALARRLTGMGVRVLAQGRNDARLAQLQGAGCQVVKWSLEEPLTPAQRADLPEIKAVIHAAALSAPFGPKQKFSDANITGTNAVLKLAKQHGAHRFIMISSPSVYFTLKDQLLVHENAELPRPFNHYAWSKVEAEKLVTSSDIPSRLILRPRGIYGPGETTLLPRILQAAQTRPLPVFRDGRAQIDLTYVDDAVEAIVAALTCNPGVKEGVFNVSGGEVVSIRNLVELSCKRAGVPVRWRPMRLRPALAVASIAERLANLNPNAKEPAFTRYGLALFAFQQSLDISRIKQEFSWFPKVTFAEGLDRTFRETEA